MIDRILDEVYEAGYNVGDGFKPSKSKHDYLQPKVTAIKSLITTEIIAEFERLDKKFSPEGAGFIEIDEVEATALLRDRIKELKSKAKETQL